MRTRFIILMVVMTACNTQKQAVNSGAEPVKPSWVTDRPTGDRYYTGIGVAAKAAGGDYRKTAKENAIADLAGEIRVEVSSQSLLYTLETRTGFEQAYRESITTQSNLFLSDYQMEDSWEDATAYWVYYRLDREVWAEKQRAQKAEAQAMALDFLTKAQMEETRMQFSTATDYYLRGLQTLEAFWNEGNEVIYHGDTIHLGTALYGGLTALIAGTKVELDGPLRLTYATGFRADARIGTTRNPHGDAMRGVPVSAEYRGRYATVKSTSTTDDEGTATLPISEADPSGKPNILRVAVDLNPLLKSFTTDPFMRALTSSLHAHRAQEPIAYLPPRVHVSSVEKNLGRAMNPGPIALAVSQSLMRKQVGITADPTAADILIHIESHTIKTGSVAGFRTTRLECNLTATDVKDGNILYRATENQVTGSGINYPSAGQNAYENLTGSIESRLMRPLTTSLF